MPFHFSIIQQMMCFICNLFHSTRIAHKYMKSLFHPFTIKCFIYPNGNCCAELSINQRHYLCLSQPIRALDLIKLTNHRQVDSQIGHPCFPPAKYNIYTFFSNPVKTIRIGEERERPDTRFLGEYSDKQGRKLVCVEQ